MSSGSRGVFILRRLVYYAILLTLAAGVLKGYLLWLDKYQSLHPEVASAEPMGYVEELPLDGVLIWDEIIVTAPNDGVLTYPSSAPRRVMKGDNVAALDGVGVKAVSAGYFVPALDGEEGNWVYSRLWPGIKAFPPVGALRVLENGARLHKGDPVGKLVPQLQDLRCVAYLDKTDSLMRDIERGFVEIKTERDGKIQRSVVNTHWDAGQKIKVYLTLPFFPASAITARTFSCGVITGSSQGVSVPESAVVVRGGKTGVLMVTGSMTEFTGVEGFPVDGHNFFITNGVTAGNIVVRYADKIKEGEVRLW